MKFNYEIAFWTVIVIAGIFFSALVLDHQFKEKYNEGYQAGAYFIIGQITTTQVVPYFEMDNSTGNLTIKYLDLNKK